VKSKNPGILKNKVTDRLLSEEGAPSVDKKIFQGRENLPCNVFTPRPSPLIYTRILPIGRNPRRKCRLRKTVIFRSRILLKTGHDYRFRYLLNGERWKNDWAAIHDKHKYSNKYSAFEWIVLIRQFRCFVQGG